MFSYEVHQFAACVAASREDDFSFYVLLDQILQISLPPLSFYYL